MSAAAPAMVSIKLSDEAMTTRLGADIAARLAPGMLVLLEGDLGAGKTALARAIIRALTGNPVLDVPSPSFALVQPYDGPSGPVLHADLYRLGDASETRELGLFDEADAIILIEWPDRDPGLADQADLIVALEQGAGDTERRAGLYSPSGRFDCAALASTL